MTENSYKTPCGCIHYFVNIIDKQKITLVFLPGLTLDICSAAAMNFLPVPNLFQQEHLLNE